MNSFPANTFLCFQQRDTNDMWDVMSYVVKYVHVNMYNVVLHGGWIVLVAEGGLVNKYRYPSISILEHGCPHGAILRDCNLFID